MTQVKGDSMFGLENIVHSEEKAPEGYSPIKLVIGIGKTKKEALERMLKYAEVVGADAIYGFKQSPKPNDSYFTERCEGIAYKKNSPSP